MQDEAFGDNPFSRLDSGQYPDAQANELKSGDGISLDADEESRKLFLDSMRNLQLKKSSSGGFSLAECGVDLPVLKSLEEKNSKVKKKKKQKKVFKKEESSVSGGLADAPVAREKNKNTDEDSEAFLWAMRNARPLKQGGRMVAPFRRQMEAKAVPDREFADMLDENLEFALMNSDEYVEGYVTGLDEAVLNRLRAGQFGPEAHLDLHGLNSMQAFEAVRDFIRACWFKGMRNVLLVPGRGLNSPNGRSILRQKLQQWLPNDPFKRVVLAFCTAIPRDGGPGSIYVLLRTSRKKGYVHWERMPPDPDLYL